MPGKNRISEKFVYSLLALSFFATSTILSPIQEASAMSSIGGSFKHATFKSKSKKKTTSAKAQRVSHESQSKRSIAKAGKGKGKKSQALLAKSQRKGARGRKEKAAPVVVVHAPALESLSDSLSTATLKSGLVHKMYRGKLHVNVVEVDLKNKNLAVRPYLASDYFNKLKTTEEHAKESGALVAVNANYFKKDGTPLGTLLMDGEWIAGSIYNRVAMGLTESRDVKFDRVDVHGILNTSNPDIPSLWVNTVNQPRRSGTHLILYTQRWGSYVKIPYDGCLVAVSNTGEVIGTDARNLYIPAGGFVLCDKKDSKLARLKRFDHVFLSWKTNPNNWSDVVQSVSGGPTLIRDGKVLVDVQDEKFGKSFSSAKISRRTACGVTADKKMIIITVEGQHNIYSLAKLMLKLGCVDAMNLDGGGSTSMVVMGKTVTQNRSSQRRVAASLVVMDSDAARQLVKTPTRNYMPKQEIVDFLGEEPVLSMEPFKARSVFLTENDVTRVLTCASGNFSEEVVAMEMGLKNSTPEGELLAGLSQNLITIDNDQAQKNANLLQLQLKPTKHSKKMLKLHQKVESKFLLPFRFGRPKS